MSELSPREIEKKWQKKWKETGLYKTDFNSAARPKYYNLVMFPYPSAAKLHIGHWYNFGGADTWGRYMRMKGYNVFEPIGFDAFGLPAENYAVKTGVHPQETTYKNIEYMREQLSAIGAMYDWDKEIVTSDPEYYKWTQWIFLKFFEAGLAYRKMAPVNWCPKCQTCLANEQVKDGKCERCGSEVTKKDMEQWFFNVKKYAERLLNNENLDWPEKTKIMQKNWIGRSEGVNIDFPVFNSNKKITVFTSYPETIFGATYMVLAPEHPLVSSLTDEKHKKIVEKYIEKARHQTDIKRSATDKEKTGVMTGGYCINPVTKEKIPVFIGDYVLMSYGTGAVMGVPAHDARDWLFAVKHKLPIVRVMKTYEGDTNEIDKLEKVNEEGIMMNSGQFNGMDSKEAKKKIAEWIEREGFGKITINYKLRDWLISRQRYWGAPIPVVYCKQCEKSGNAPDGIVPVPEKDLPVLLPKNVDFIPRGKSPLHYVKDFIETTCPKCGGPAERESDTMDTFVDSSWYFLRYLSPKKNDGAFDKEMIKKWMPVDMYIGGSEHACMHLIYARFFTMVLHDLGYLDFDEPFKRLVHQGTITKDSAKMSKSKGNVVSPDEFVEKYGSDVFRMYLMFMGPFTAGGDWSDKGINGVARFIKKFSELIENNNKNKLDHQKTLNLIHKTIKRVTESIETFQFNTAIAAMMEFTNEISSDGIDMESKKIMVRLIAPFAPHTAEELWERLGQKYSVFDEEWPKFDDKYLASAEIEIPVQVNGKLRAVIRAAADEGKEKILERAKNEPNVKKYLEGAKIVKEIYVPGKLAGFVTD